MRHTLTLMLALFLALPCAHAQSPTTVAIGSGSGLSGTVVALPITFTSGGAAVASLQFTITHPSSDLTVTMVTQGAALATGGKTIQCRPMSGATVCVVSGIAPPNANSIPDGVVGVVGYQIAGGLSDRTDVVNVTGVVASSPGGQGLSAGGVGGMVAIGMSPPPPTAWTISGNVGVGGAQVRLSGAAVAGVTSGATGGYSFAGLANGAYTVTPGKQRCNFNPPTQAVTVSGGAKVVNFTAAGRHCR